MRASKAVTVVSEPPTTCPAREFAQFIVTGGNSDGVVLYSDSVSRTTSQDGLVIFFFFFYSVYF